MVSSQYSILRQYTPYVNPYNIDLIKDVTMYKQGKVDAAREKIYTQMDYLMGQEIDKPEARVYMEDKMSAVVADINNKFKGMDLSSDGVTRTIQGQISTVLDDTVINAIAGTKEGKRVRNEIESIRLNHPELYSPINEWEAMKPYYEWRSDGKAGSRLGALHYSPYVDYNKELNKMISEYRKNNKGKKVQTTEYDSEGNPTGGIIETSVDDLSYSQIKNIVAANLSENMRNQIRIEALYMADTNPVFKDQGMVSAYLNSHLDRYDRQIAALEAKKKSVGDNKYLQDSIDSKIQEAKNLKAESKREVDAIIGSGNPVAAASFVVTNNLFDNMANAWMYDNTSYERKKDDLYFARLKEARDQGKFNMDNAKSMIEISNLEEDLKQKRIETEFMSKHGYKMGTMKLGKQGEGSGGAGLIAEGSQSYTPTSVSMGTSTSESINLGNIPYQQVVSASEKKKEGLLRFYNSLSDTDRYRIEAAIEFEKSQYPGKYDGLGKEESSYVYIRTNGGQKNGYLCQSNNRASEIYDEIRIADAQLEGANNVIKDLSNYQKDNIVTPGNKEMISALRSGFQKKGLNDDNYLFMNITKTDGNAGAFLLGAAMLSGEVKDVQTLGQYVKDPRRLADVAAAIDPRLGPALYGAGLFRNVISAFIKGDGKTQSATLAAINGMKELNGDKDFNISDYITIDKNGNAKIKEYKEGEPVTITQLRYMSDNIGVTASLVSGMADAVNISVSPSSVSDFVSKNHYLDSYQKRVWSSNAPSKSVENAQFRELSKMMGGKIAGLDPTAIHRIDMVSRYENGKINRYLVAQYGTGKNSGVTEEIAVSDDELRRNGFDPSVQKRNFPVDTYKSVFGVCDFVDVNKKEGRSYDKLLVNNDLPFLASKKGVKESFYNILQTYGSYLRPEDFSVMRNLIDNITDMSDQIAVQLEGVNDRGSREIAVNFYDAKTINSEEPKLLFSDFIPLESGNDEYADYWNNIQELAPQFFFRKYMQEALMERLTSMREQYVKGQDITRMDDKFGKINDVYIKKAYAEQ